MLPRSSIDQDLLKMLEDLEKNGNKNDIHNELKLTLMNFWFYKKMSVESVFKALELHKKLTSNISAYVDRLALWFWYSQKDCILSTDEVVEIINCYDVDVRVRILNSARQIEGTEEIVDSLENSLLLS